MRLYTIGHSTRSIEEFLALLTANGVRQLVDIRTFPGSRRYPHFGREALARELARHDIAYVHLAALGGRRRALPDTVNAGWRNASFRGYADYMQTPEFEAGLGELMALAAEATTSIMCAEAVPWRCHRSLVTDALLARGVDVRHIIDGEPRPAVRTPFARVGADGRITYPPAEAADGAGNESEEEHRRS